MQDLKVVARYLNGKMAKGIAQDFDPDNDTFILLPADAGPDATAAQVRLSELKALFFVKDLDGNRNYRERTGFHGEHGREFVVKFKDGETLFCSTRAFNPDGIGFFVNPADPKSNNLRIFVVNAAVEKISPL